MPKQQEYKEFFGNMPTAFILGMIIIVTLTVAIMSRE